MKLITSPTSVYGRKIRMLIREKGLAIDEEFVNPWTNRPALLGVNPLSKIPVLVLDDGTNVYDSVVIADYIDTLGAPRMLPANKDKRVRMLGACALCRSMTDMCTAIVGSRLLQAELPEAVREWHLGKVEAGLEDLERRLVAKEFGKSRPWLVDLEAAALLGFFDFRMPEDVEWRKSRKRLARWFKRFAQRPSFQDTLPPQPAP